MTKMRENGHIFSSGGSAMKTRALARLAVLGLLLVSPFFSPSAEAQCVVSSNLSIRLGRPLVVRGPFADELDNPYHEIKLASGSYRGFSANGSSYKIDGPEPWSMGWPRTVVMAPGPAGSDASCGRWLNDTEKVAGGVHGFFHAEQSCNYNAGQTHKSFGFATSTNEGTSWSIAGLILTGRDVPTPNKITGEGDCTVVNGADGYYYAYCLRASDWRTIVARAPIANPNPGQWWKRYAGSWSQPGLGGNADSLGFLGVGAARWTNRNAIWLLGGDKWHGGLKASVSCDKVSFATLGDPLIPMDDENWNRPAPTELLAYPSLMNYTDANNQVGDAFLLTHVYIQPNESFDKRYLVFRDVAVTVAPAAVVPQVGIALNRWYSAAAKDRWTTTAPVPGNFSTYAFEGTLGYLMTKPHPTLPTNKLEDCSSTWPGHLEHMLTNDGTCAPAGYTRLRTAGWVFVNPQPNTVPIYRCWNPTQTHHFASTSATCEGLGTMEWRLGYALAS
jgi:hypothetical protein